MRGRICKRRKAAWHRRFAVKQLPGIEPISACGADNRNRAGAAAVRFGCEDARLQRTARQQRAFGVQRASTDKFRIWFFALFFKHDISGVNQNLPHLFMRERRPLGAHQRSDTSDVRRSHRGASEQTILVVNLCAEDDIAGRGDIHRGTEVRLIKPPLMLFG